MPALKEILDGLPGLSILAASRFWDQPVECITPAALQGFVWKMSEQGLRDQTETALELALTAVTRAVGRSELPVPPMLNYSNARRLHMTTMELRRGLALLGGLRAALCMFALETGLTLHAAVHLTHRGLATFKSAHTLSVLAQSNLAMAPPRHVRLQYVFWEPNEDQMPLPLFGMDEALFNAFGTVWAEVVEGYAHLIDTDTDRRSIDCFLNR